jgi:hypothetical protein
MTRQKAKRTITGYQLVSEDIAPADVFDPEKSGIQRPRHHTTSGINLVQEEFEALLESYLFKS